MLAVLVKPLLLMEPHWEKLDGSELPRKALSSTWPTANSDYKEGDTSNLCYRAPGESFGPYLPLKTRTGKRGVLRTRFFGKDRVLICSKSMYLQPELIDCLTSYQSLLSERLPTLCC